MKTVRKATVASVMFGILLTIPLLAATPETDIARTRQEQGQADQPQALQIDARTRAAQQLPVYVPPLRGAPASRVGGASRGTHEASVTFSVLAPEHTGLTVSPQPPLYWYLSKPAAARLELTLIDEQAIKPLAEIRLARPEAPGIQHINLSEHGISLKPGVEYQWFVALVPDPRQRSNDILSGGTIRYIARPSALVAQLKRTNEQRHHYVYAEAGIWYDAIAKVSGLIEDRPDDAALKTQRAALLQQVGLADIAALDMNAATR